MAEGIIDELNIAKERLPYFSAVWYWDETGSAYTNNTLAARKSSTTFNWVSDIGGDYMYLGHESKFDLIDFAITTAGSYAGLKWEYWDGASWTEFVPEYSYGFDDTHGVERFIDLPNWTTLAFSNSSPHTGTVPDTNTRYWVRVSATTVTTTCVVTSIAVRPRTTYATPTTIAKLLQIPEDFTSTTNPSREEVQEMIRRAEDRIDYVTKKSWRLNYDDEALYDFNINGIKARNYPIRNITYLAVWDGASWDQIDEGRPEDFFYHDEFGIIYFSRYFQLPARFSYSIPGWRWGFGEFKFGVKLSYTWGYDFFNNRFSGFVEDLTAKIVAVDIINTFDRTTLAKMVPNVITLDQKAMRWEQQVEMKLEELAGLEIA